MSISEIIGEMIYVGLWIIILIISYYVGDYFFAKINLKESAKWKKLAVGFLITAVIMSVLIVLIYS
jgi:hypothetical protein